MSLNSKKVISLVTALSMSAVFFSSMNISAADEYTQFPYTCECEDLILEDGMTTWTDIYGTKIGGEYSGDGFIYLSNGTITMEVTVPEDDMYEIEVKYAQILSEDGREQTISINDVDFMYKFPYSDSWTNYSFGVHRFKKGKNIIKIKPQYGYACYDTITVKKAELPDLSSVKPVLSDSKATKEAQGLMNYLCSVYGKNIISGQQEIYGGGNDGNTELEFDWIKDLTGELPAIRGFDFMNYNPLYGWDDNTTERAIDWTNEKNGIVTASWHINVPQDFDSYELGDEVDWQQCTYKPTASFNAANASVKGTKEYEYFMLAVDDLAEQLLRLQEANVPVLFRPLHEAEGNGGLNGEGAWFWWSSSGAEAFKDLWKLLYTTLTEKYGLHNLIWEENLYTWSPESAEWYVGDDYVDIVGYDKYNVEYNRHDGKTSGPNEDAISSVFYGLVDIVKNKKLVSMPENDTVPTIENLKVEKAGWLYFCPWYGEHLMSERYNDPATLKSIYQSDYTITLDELPDWKNYKADVEPDVTTSETEEPDVTTSESVSGTATKLLLGDVTENGEIDIRDVTLMNQYIVGMLDLSEQAMLNSDVVSDGEVNVKDLGQLKKYIVKLIDKF